MDADPALAANEPRTVEATNARTDPTNRYLFAQDIILKFSLIAHAKLELAGGTIILIMADGHAVFKTQWPEVWNIQQNTHSPVVVEISRERIRTRADITDVIEQFKPDTRSWVPVNDGNIVIQRT